MGTRSVGSWNTAMGAAGDTIRAAGLFPGICALLFAVYVFQSAASGLLEEPGTSSTTILCVTALMLGSAIVATALTIPLTRTYAGGTPTELFARPFLRILGWIALLTLAAVVLIAVMVGILMGISLMLGDAYALSPVHWAVVLFIIPVTWLALRLTTLWPSLALDEPAPVLQRSFRETKGHVWYFLLTFICSLAVFIPLMIATFIVAYILAQLGVSGVGAKLALGAINGALGLFSIVYTCSLYGRFLRAVRGQA